MQLTGLLVVLVVVIGVLGAVLVLAIARLTVTTRQAARRLARAEASEHLSEQIIADLGSGLLVVGVGGEIRIVNPTGRRLLGLDPGAIGPLRELADPSVRPLVEVVDECLATKSPIARRTLELGPSRRRGAPTHFGVSVSPLLDEAGTFQGAICLYADLSAVVDLEERVRLQDSLAQVGELAAGVAHQFRNGLATIHGYSRLISLDRVHADYRPFIEAIRQETIALREVIDKFLGFARPAALSVTPVSLQKVIDRVVEDIQGDVSGRGGTVVCRGEFPDIEGDEVLLRQAMGNLCRNAVDACVDARIVPAVEIEGTVDTEHGQARITVTDNGPGFDPQERDRMFRPFFTTRSDGTGLGLAVTQKIVVTHHGSITASLTEEGGARMEVVLPMQRVSNIV